MPGGLDILLHSGASVVAQQVWLFPMMPTSHIGLLVQVLDILCSLQPPVSIAEDRPGAGVPDFGLTQPFVSIWGVNQ